jgi:hypothetical protein
LQLICSRRFPPDELLDERGYFAQEVHATSCGNETSSSNFDGTVEVEADGWERRERKSGGQEERNGWKKRMVQQGRVPEKGGKDAAEDREGLPKRLG